MPNTETDLSGLSAEIRKRYEGRGDTLSGTTKGDMDVVEVGPMKGLTRGTYARYATLMNYSGGVLLFGRERSLGSYALAVGQGYTFDYVDVFGIVIKDDGNKIAWTIDYTGP